MDLKALEVSLRHLLSSVVSIARKKLCCLSGGIKLRQFNQSQKISFSMEAYQSVTLVLYKRESSQKKKKKASTTTSSMEIYLNKSHCRGAMSNKHPSVKAALRRKWVQCCRLQFKASNPVQLQHFVSYYFFFTEKVQNRKDVRGNWSQIPSRFTCCTWPLSPGECVSQLSDWEQPRGRVFVHL